MTLRGYQLDAIDSIRAAYKSGCRSVMYSLFVGGGKTKIFSAICDGVYRSGKRALVLVHRHELLKQAVKNMESNNIPCGIIKGQVKNGNLPVTVASVQSLFRKPNAYGEFDLIIADEAHHSTAKTYKTIFHTHPKARLLGVTATPERLDGAPLSSIYERLIEGPPAKWLIEQGYLSKYKIVQATATQRSRIGIRGGEFDLNQAAEAFGRTTIGNAVESYTKYCAYKPALAFCCTIKHAMETAEIFRAAGYSALHIDGGMDEMTIAAALNGLRNGSVHVVTSCQLIGEGLDIPACEAVIMLRATMSRTEYIQEIGRALRYHEGKEFAMILDHVGNFREHGPPDADYVWAFDGGEKRGAKTAKSLTKCRKCYASFNAKLAACPRCGTDKETKGVVVKNIDGVMEEVTDEMLKAFYKDSEEDARRRQDWKRFEMIRKEKGYKQGWTFIQVNLESKKRMQKKLEGMNVS